MYHLHSEPGLEAYHQEQAGEHYEQSARQCQVILDKQIRCYYKYTKGIMLLVRDKTQSESSLEFQTIQITCFLIFIACRLSRSTTRTSLYEEYPLSGAESLAKDYFPVTMSAYKIEHVEPPLSR